MGWNEWVVARKGYVRHPDRLFVCFYVNEHLLSPFLDSFIPLYALNILLYAAFSFFLNAACLELITFNRLVNVASPGATSSPRCATFLASSNSLSPRYA